MLQVGHLPAYIRIDIQLLVKALAGTAAVIDLSQTRQNSAGRAFFIIATSYGLWNDNIQYSAQPFRWNNQEKFWVILWCSYLRKTRLEFRSPENEFVHTILSRYQTIVEFCLEHDSITAVI